jgi:predicted nucleotidyltransferase component of viral defense system
MSDLFLKLPAGDRREALGVAAASSGRPLHLLDKDVWLVWILEVLFQAPFATHLVFKGGSSLSKAYQIISRFSEDVDLTYDIRALAPDLVGEEGERCLRTGARRSAGRKRSARGCHYGSTIRSCR